MAISAEVLQDVEKTLGIVPTFIRELEYDPVALEHSWELVKKFILGESLIPAKYRELMGIAVAAALHCRFCVTFHSTAARLFGATQRKRSRKRRFWRSMRLDGALLWMGA